MKRLVILTTFALLALAPAVQATPLPGCYAISGKKLYLKPATLTTYFTWDGSERSDEIPFKRGQRFKRARGCSPYPEAALGTKGKTFKGKTRDGTVLGLSLIHI